VEAQKGLILLRFRQILVGKGIFGIFGVYLAAFARLRREITRLAASNAIATLVLVSRSASEASVFVWQLRRDETAWFRLPRLKHCAFGQGGFKT
jgi:hypothetical protein